MDENTFRGATGFHHRVRVRDEDGVLELSSTKIPMHNNAAKRLFRALDSGRHKGLFAGSEDSAHNLAVLMGLAANCRLQGIEPQNYLAWAIERRGTWRDQYGLHPQELTPAAYELALAAAKAQRDGHGVGLSASGGARVRGWLMGHLRE